MRANPQEVEESGRKVSRMHLRAGYVLPAFKRVLIDDSREGFVMYAVGLAITGDDLDIEDPFRDEGFGENGLQARIDAEELRSALCVVNGQLEDDGSGSSEDAAQVVAERVALDVTPQELDARTKHHGDLRFKIEHLDEAVDSVEAGGKIGVPVTHQASVYIADGMQQAGSHSFALAAINGAAKNGCVRLGTCAEFFEDADGVIFAAVIDK